MEDDVTGYFTPERYDAALTFLGRILGCSMKALWTAGGGNSGTCSDANDLVATLAKTLNIGMLAIIAVVATYLIFAAIKNTALDGQVGGRSMNPGWTLVLAAIAAILCVPLSSGFSALQIGVMQTAVWSSGFGDTIWKKSYEKMFSSAANTATVSSGTRSTEAATNRIEELRGQVAVALRVRVIGEICAREMTAAVASMSTVQEGSVTSVGPTSSTANGITFLTTHYQAGAAFNNASGLCGRYSISYPSPSQTAPTRTSSDDLVGDEASREEIVRIIDQASRTVASSVATSLSTNIQSEASTLATSLVPQGGVAQLGTTQTDMITQSVDRIMQQATQSAQSGLRQIGGSLGSAISKAMQDSTKRGWLFSVLYQRVLVNATTAQEAVGSGVAISASPPEEDLAAVLGCRGVGGMSFWRESCAEVQNIFMARMATAFGNYERISAAFSNAAIQSPTTGSNSTDIPGLGSSQGSLSTGTRAVINYVTGVDNSAESGEGWVDPIPQIQATGGTMMSVGAALAAFAALGDAAAALAQKIPFIGTIAAGAASALAYIAGPLGMFLFAVGFILGVLVPMLPLIYFFAAGISWMISVCMAVFTAPFYLMQMFYPNSQGGVQGTGLGKALVLLAGIIVRPALLVVGLLICMVVMRASLDVWNILSRNMFSALSGNAKMGAVSATVTDIVMIVSAFFVYAVGAALLVIWCCQLISGVADAAMEALESGASRLFSDSGRMQMEGAMAGAAAGLGSRMVPNLNGRSLSGVGNKIAQGINGQKAIGSRGQER